MDNTFFNSVELMRLLNKWKKHLLIIGVVSLAASTFFSSPLFIKPKYKSTAIVYPSNLIAYSTESPTEQMLQIAQSSDIREKIIKTFHLAAHYDIDTTAQFYKTYVNNTYEENVSIKKTEYESMEVTVYDTDPVQAAAMADSIISYFNVKVRTLQKEKAYETMITAKEQLVKKKAEMDSMELILEDYSSKYGLLDFRSQSREVTRAILRSGSGRTAEASNLMQALREKGQAYNSASEHIWRTRGAYNDLKATYEGALREVNKDLTYSTVVTRPEPSDKKAYPVRWLIVLISTGTSLLLGFMVLLVFNSKRQLQEA